jgi:hypothetical protein
MPLPKLAIPALVVVATLAAAHTPGHAQTAYSYPWCAVYPRTPGTNACYYKSYESCMKTMRTGIGGYCMQSPFYRGPAAGTEPARRRYGRHT